MGLVPEKFLRFFSILGVLAWGVLIFSGSSMPTPVPATTPLSHPQIRLEIPGLIPHNLKTPRPAAWQENYETRVRSYLAVSKSA